jgi:hypothetical protein
MLGFPDERKSELLATDLRWRLVRWAKPWACGMVLHRGDFLARETFVDYEIIRPGNNRMRRDLLPIDKPTPAEEENSRLVMIAPKAARDALREQMLNTAKSRILKWKEFGIAGWTQEQVDHAIKHMKEMFDITEEDLCSTQKSNAS